MDAPFRDTHESGKKTRATSCTACRQVKLKCDLRERYPNACSRCTSNQHECKTDASFKRVPARSRIKDLESQLDQLKRNRALLQATPLTTQVELPTASERRTSSESRLVEAIGSCVLSSTPSSTSSPAAAEHVRSSNIRWLNIVDMDLPTQFALDDVVLSYQDVLDGFQHFDAYYIPHFHILDPVFSLLQLQHESRLLFWSIIVVAAQTHGRLSQKLAQIQATHARLYAATTQEALSSLLDVQAILVVCTWPHPASSKLQDPSWMQLGMAINAARQMGLDMSKDDVLTGTGGSRSFVGQYSQHSRQMTWFKCFELDVQMSCWHGHIPSLALPHSLRSIMRFCDAVSSSFGYAAIIHVQVELAQSLLAFEGPLPSDARSQTQMVRMFNERLSAIKARWSAAWTIDCEIECLVSQMYFYGLWLVKAEEQSTEAATAADFGPELLEACRAFATQLIDIASNLGAEMLAAASPASTLSSIHTLLGHPRHHVRSIFFAAIILLKYLDAADNSNPDDIDSAHNAFGRAYQMISRSTDNSDAAGTLEICGRAIGRGQGQLKPFVTSRLGASLRFNVIRLAYQVQENEQLNVQSSRAPATDYVFTHPQEAHVVQYDSNDQQVHPYDIADFASTYAELQSAWVQTTQSMAPLDFAGQAVPFGVWDNSMFENWALASPPFGALPES